jgi:hypothetical protein
MLSYVYLLIRKVSPTKFSIKEWKKNELLSLQKSRVLALIDAEGKGSVIF